MGEHPVTESNPLTIEHIIPELIGGTLTVKNVCKHCNSSMGAGFEAKASKNITFQLPRYINGLAGKSGKVPNPFVHTSEKDEFGGKYTVSEDLSVKTLPQIKAVDDKIVLIVDKSENHKAREMIKSRLKRQVKTKYNIVLNNAQLEELTDLHLKSATVHEQRVEQPKLEMVHQMDEMANKLVYIKVAYELAVYHFGYDYTSDEHAQFLQACLYTQHAPETLEWALPKTESFGTSSGEKCHIVRFENNLCSISLFGFAYMLKFSESKAYEAKNPVQYVFDYINRSYSCVEL